MAIRISKDDKGQNIYVVYINGYDNKKNRIQKIRKGIKSLHKAQAIEFELKRQLSNLKDKGSEHTFEEWFNLCIKNMTAELKNSTIMNYHAAIEKWVMPHWKEKFLSEVTSSDVHELIFSRLGSELSSYTRKNVLKMIKRLFAMALEDGLLNFNPALKVKVKVPEVKQLVLNENEIEKLLREAKLQRHRYYEIWAVAILTGMRSGELYSLTWNDVDLNNKFINVSKSWSSKNGFGPTKNSKNRMVPVSPELKKLLIELKIKAGNSEFVLPHLPEWTAGLQAEVLKDFCVGIGLPAVKFHDLRATFITHLLKKGVSLAKVMAIVGHSSLKTTQGYLRLAGMDLVGATDDFGITLPSETKGNLLSLSNR